MEAIIGGFVGFIAAFAVFALGFAFGRKTAQRPGAHQASKDPAMNDKELARIEDERKKLEAEQEAFRSLVGYNADIAYGLSEFPFGGEK